MICAETADHQILRDLCLRIVGPLIQLLHLSPVGRRSRPFQRGGTECQAWNERIYLAAILRLRLRRAEELSGLGSQHNEEHLEPLNCINCV
jgi:hypothetical protein